MKNLLISLTIIVAIVSFNACKKKEPFNTTEKGGLTFSFENVVGNQALNFGSTIYQNENGDSFAVNRYAYYITAVQLVDASGKTVAHKDFNFLIDAHDPQTMHYTFTDVPAGQYAKINVTLGVDSIHNVSGAQTGALDPIHGMFWDWNTGYIMAKLEGTSPQSPLPSHLISFHLGGFSGRYNVVKKVSLDLPQALDIRVGKESKVVFQSDVLKWFNGPNTTNFSQTYSLMSIDYEAYQMSENYKNHLSVKSVTND